jgi:hypothetical protein
MAEAGPSVCDFDSRRYFYGELPEIRNRLRYSFKWNELNFDLPYRVTHCR